MTTHNCVVNISFALHLQSFFPYCMYICFRKLVWIFSSSATFEYFSVFITLSVGNKTFALVPRLLKLWPCAQADIFTKDQVTLQMLPHFWKMPLAVASQEAAEFSQAQPVRCGRGGFGPHISESSIWLLGVSLIPMERMGRAQAEKRESMESWTAFCAA